jgi:hypothetical protein
VCVELLQKRKGGEAPLLISSHCSILLARSFGDRLTAFASWKYVNVFTIERCGSASGTIVLPVEIRQDCAMPAPLTVPAAPKTPLTEDQSQPAGRERVAAILARSKAPLIENWLARAKKTPQLNHLHLSDEERTGHLPRLVDDLVVRLCRPNLSAKDNDAIASAAAVEHGQLRRKQGYSSAMLIHESRILQVTVFGILHDNLSLLDVKLLLPDVMIIADEVDSQLTQTMGSFTQGAPKSVRRNL